MIKHCEIFYGVQMRESTKILYKIKFLNLVIDEERGKNWGRAPGKVRTKLKSERVATGK
jgi:hypothetical protein